MRSIFLTAALFLVASPLFAAATRLAHITQIESNRMFPVQTVLVQYVRACNEVRTDVIKRSVFQNGIVRTGLGVVLAPTGRHCYMYEPAEITETVKLTIYAEQSTDYFSLENVKQPGTHSGLSVDNFN